MLIVGLPFTVPMEDSCLLSSLPWREDFWRLHLELGIKNEEKKETKKIARGIFRSLAPLLGTAGSLSDCGIKPTIAELNFSRR